MSYRVHQVNKKTGVTYVYEATSVWDKEKQQPRNKQLCIGKIDPKTGEFIPSKRLNPEQAAASVSRSGYYHYLKTEDLRRQREEQD